MNKKLLNAVLCAIFVGLLIAMPVRNLLFVQAPPGDRGDSFVTTSWILLCLFGALALVFGVRAISAFRDAARGEAASGRS